MIGSLGGPELGMLTVMLAGGLVAVAFPAGRICVRAGFPAWLGLLAVVPLVNIGLLWFVAFTEWPATHTPSPEDQSPAA